MNAISQPAVSIWRETNVERINAIVNHPDVRPWIADGVGVIDLTAQVADTRNVLLMGEHGGMMFLWAGPGIYECHTQVLPAYRGEWTRRMTEACARYMFTLTDAFEIMTRVPAGHVAAKAATEAGGGKLEFTRPNNTLFRGRMVDCHIYSFRLQDWVPRAEGIEETGQWMHRRMEEEAVRLGIEDPPHDDDPNHNRYLGAAVEMAFGGQPVKACLFYNRWVTAARHMRNGVLQHISIVSTNPMVAKFDIGLMRFHADDIEVIKTC